MTDLNSDTARKTGKVSDADRLSPSPQAYATATSTLRLAILAVSGQLTLAAVGDA